MKQLEIEGKFLNLIKDIHEKLTAIIIHKSERLHTIPLG